MRLVNTLFGTCPIVVHAHGSHEHKPYWPPIRERFFGSPARVLPAPEGLTILTCNNGHPAMGLLERSLAHLGLRGTVAGAGLDPWVNALHKPRAIRDALAAITTPYVLYADSRDAILIDDPRLLLERFEADFDCDLVFGADRLSWPPRRDFKRFERSVAGGAGDFWYLNGGAWLGRTPFCREFYAAAVETPPVPEAPDSEQGVLRQLFPRFHPRVQLDYRCGMFQNLGFVLTPILEIDG
jgi:hypothetical protein